MKDRTIQIVRAVLASLMNYGILFTLAATLIGIAGGGAPDLWRWGLLCLMPLAFLYFRLRPKFMLCFAGHVLTAAVFGGIVYKDSVNGVVSLAAVIGFFIYSLVLRGNKKDVLGSPMQPVVAVGIAAAGLFFNNMQGESGLTVYYLVPVLLYLGLYFIYGYLHNFSSFLVVNDSSAGRIPQGEIFRCGILLVSVFSIGSVALMALFSGTSILSDLLTVIRAVLVWILRLLFRNNSSSQEVDTVTEEVSDSSDGLYGLEGGEPGWLWEVLEKIAIALLVAGLIALVVYGLYRLVKFLYERFHDVALPEGADQEIRTDVREKCGVEKSKRSVRARALDRLSAGERIRRIYKKEVWNGRYILVKEGDAAERLSSMTARECGQGLNKQELSDIYEKVRYSKETCTGEDVKRARAAAKEGS
ncbi:MAG: DUF4129 domain-containing protein [Lachnospiraceae bacterium]|nr:DUF4129 domain-containing protein [Lachnospiraceae bacterium]